MQTTNTILLIRPASFGFNVETALSNTFQNTSDLEVDIIQQKALEEFENFAKILQKNGVEVIIIDDTKYPPKPDAIFPNNWFSTHENGQQIIIYPMCTPNRQIEKRADIIAFLKERQPTTQLVDLSSYEKKEMYLEGTGSLVLDRKNACIYACLSPRTNKELVEKIGNILGYKTCLFRAVDKLNVEIYHTNVMMSVGDGFAVVCLECIVDKIEQKMLQNFLESAGLELIEITKQQVLNFAGNMLALTGKEGQILVLSQSAFDCLTIAQISIFEKYASLVPIAIPTIEQVGGGSVRCMMGELF